MNQELELFHENKKTKFDGLYIINLNSFKDDRGEFLRLVCKNKILNLIILYKLITQLINIPERSEDSITKEKICRR